MLEIAKHLTFLRKKEFKTQQDVANYIGVTTAAVSKWETGQSYPDIMILPKLATYYNITIDELLSYEPQMTKENIQKLYSKLAEEFNNKPFEEVFDSIQQLVKEYYSCFPLLMQLAILLLNYLQLAQEKTQEVYSFINTLCLRIQQHSTDLKHVHLSRSIQAQIALMTNQPKEVLAILGEQIEPYAGNDLLLANAYLQLNDIARAEETYQVSLFQKTISNLSLLSNYLQLQVSQSTAFNETVKRGLGIIELFNLEKLHINSCLIFYISAAQAYITQGNEQQAISMLERYRKVTESLLFPITLHGDDYFNQIDEWIIRELDLGQGTPRDDESIRQSLLDSILLNPAFETLKESSDFTSIISSIRHSLWRN